MTNKIVLWIGASVNTATLVYNLSGENILTWINVVVVSNLTILFYTALSAKTAMQQLTALVRKGRTTDDPASVIKTYLIDTHSFVDEAEFVFSKITEIGQDQFVTTMASVKNEKIRSSLLSAHGKIVNLRKKESENNWIAEQVAAIAELKHQGNDISSYSFQVISKVIKCLNANHGEFYLLRKEEDETYFDLMASYAYNKKKHLTKKIQLGDGLIGQVYYEKNPIYLTEVPADYVKITSGLGEALPRCVCIIPLKYEGEVYGVIEIASFNKLEEYQMEYLKTISENIGYNLSTIEVNSRTERLLLESQKMSQEVKSQEEELRQNMEELTATQEEMRRKQTETHAVMSSLSTVELDAEGRITDANSVFLGVTGFTLQDLQGKLYKSLIGQASTEQLQYDVMWKSILSGQSFSGEFRIINKGHKEIWMAGNFTPLLNERKTPYKVMLVSLFTTQDKEKLHELQDVVTAVKSCMPVVEINPGMTFKSANDMFLFALGVKRIELKKTLPANAFSSTSFNTIETYLNEKQEGSKELVVEINEKSGMTRRFHSTITRIGNDQHKRGLLILRNPAQ